jgi:hypothetical protein
MKPTQAKMADHQDGKYAEASPTDLPGAGDVVYRLFRDSDYSAPEYRKSKLPLHMVTENGHHCRLTDGMWEYEWEFNPLPLLLVQESAPRG